MEEPRLDAVVDALGAGCIVTASDFPHPEGTFPHGVREFARRSDLGSATARAILGDNPRRLYRLP
jgi:predicted TIM-barrel fold metal-dependent hydrolase